MRLWLLAFMVVGCRYPNRYVGPDEPDAAAPPLSEPWPWPVATPPTPPATPPNANDGGLGGLAPDVAVLPPDAPDGPAPSADKTDTIGAPEAMAPPPPPDAPVDRPVDRPRDTRPPEPPPPPPPPCPVTCSDGSCARLSWNFERGQLDGVTATVGPASAMGDLEVAAGPDGRALRVRVTLAAGQGLTVTAPICESGTVDARGRQLRGSVRIDGPPAEFSIVALWPGPVLSYQNPFVPAPAVVTFRSNVEPPARAELGAVTKFSVAIDARAPWSGVIWVDDLQVTRASKSAPAKARRILRRLPPPFIVL